MAKKKTHKCLTKKCERDGNGARGLCRNCHQSMARLVRLEKTTWEQLEAAGLCLPTYDESRSKNPAVRAIAAAGLLTDVPAPAPTET